METVEGEIVDQSDQGSVAILPAAAALESINRAEVDIQIATAHKYPRNINTFRKQAKSLVTIDEDTAGSMFYRLKRGKKQISGPSIRLAEVVASTYRNLRCASMVTDIGDTFVTSRGVVHDLESNVAVAVEVTRRITDRFNKRFSDDMIGVTCNAANAIAFREAIFKVVPRGLTDELYRAARKVWLGDESTLKDKRAEMIAYFGKLNVTLPEILAYVEKSSFDDIGLEELELLRGAATAIKDNETTVEETFRPKPTVADNRDKDADLTDRIKNGSVAPVQTENLNAESGNAGKCDDPAEFVKLMVAAAPAEIGERQANKAIKAWAASVSGEPRVEKTTVKQRSEALVAAMTDTFDFRQGSRAA